MNSLGDGAGTPLQRFTHDRLQSLPEASYRALTDEMPQMVWSTRPDGFHDYYNRRWYEFTGVPLGSTDGDGWNGMFHPDDQRKAWDVWQESLRTGKPYEVEYRLRHHSGEYRWTLGRAMPIKDDRGEIVRWVGTCTDIHEHKLLLELNALLNQELSHRIKNIFAVIGALIGLSAAGRPEHAAFAAALRERIGALGNAHEFVRPHSEKSRPAAGTPTLFGMLDKIFAAFPVYRAKRLTISGDDLPIDDQAATPLALVFHELATNALKYGALSNASGRVAIECRIAGEDAEIEWRESGGPRCAAPVRSGFGSQLIEMSIEQQLGGKLEQDWSGDGLCATFALPLARIHR